MKRVISLVELALFVTVMVVGQDHGNTLTDLRQSDSQRRVVVNGQVVHETAIAGSLTVELVTNGQGLSTTASVQPDGSFEFPAVTPGAYELRITGPGGAIVHQQAVIINGPQQNLSIDLSRGPSSDPHGGGTISIRQLQHKVPPEAQKEFKKGTAASKKSDHQGAVDHFQKAVSIDPEFADGYNNLGSAYAALGQIEQAASQFQKAIDLVPDHSLAVANLSVALCKMRHFHEAEKVARRALKLDPALLKIRYILAVSLIAEHGDSSEALDNLARAAAEVPKARLVAADVLAQTGRPADAAEQLEEYLRSASEQDTDRQKIQAWLAQLRAQ